MVKIKNFSICVSNVGCKKDLNLIKNRLRRRVLL